MAGTASGRDTYASFPEQTFTTDGSGNLTLDYAPGTAAGLIVVLGGVPQTPGVAYTVSGKTLTWTSTPSSGIDGFVLFRGIELLVPTPAADSVGATEIIAGERPQIVAPMLHVQDQKAAGTSGGQAPSTGTWFVRDLNTVLVDELGITGISSNTINGLPSGTYYMETSAPFYRTRTSAIRLYDSTGNAVLVHPFSGSYSNPNDSVSTIASIYGRFTIQGQSDLNIEAAVEASNNQNDLGVDMGTTLPVNHEVYTDVRIWKVG